MSKRTGPHSTILTATAFADTNAHACTVFQAQGNTVDLDCAIATQNAGVVTINVDISPDGGTTYFRSPLSWTLNGGSAAVIGTYHVCLEGLAVAPKNYVKVWYTAASHTTGSTLDVKALSWDNPFARAAISVGDITATVDLGVLPDPIAADGATWTDGSSKGTLVHGVYQATPQTIADGKVGPLEVDNHGNVKVNIAVQSATALPVSATAAANTALNPLYVSAAVTSGGGGAVIGTPTISHATGAGAMNNSTAISAACELVNVKLHIGATSATSENFVVTLVSGTNAAYNTVLFSIDTSLGTSPTDWTYTPCRPIQLENGDAILCTWTNTGTKTWGLTIGTRV